MSARVLPPRDPTAAFAVGIFQGRWLVHILKRLGDITGTNVPMQLVFDPEHGLQVVQLDSLPSMCCALTLAPSACQLYQVPVARTITISSSVLSDIAKNIEKADSLTFLAYEAEPDSVVLWVYRSDFNSRFKVNLRDDVQDTLDITMPDKFDAMFTCEAPAFGQQLDRAHKQGAVYVNFECGTTTSLQMTFRTSSQTSISTAFVYCLKLDNPPKISEGESFTSSTYMVKFANDIVAFGKQFTRVDVGFGSEDGCLALTFHLEKHADVSLRCLLVACAGE